MGVCLLFCVGLLFLIQLDMTITGAVVGMSRTRSGLNVLMSVLCIITAYLVLTAGKSLEDIAEQYHWEKYSLRENSVIADIEQEYLSLKEPVKRTPAQSWAERHATTRKELIEPESINKKRSYEEQFYEGHASGGGRVIDTESHVIRDKEDITTLIPNAKKGLKYYEGRLVHFGQPANGNYLWVVDEDGNFIIANRQTFHHEMSQMSKTKIDRNHRLHKLPHATLARGKQVYASGEVLIEGGLVKSYNTASGHYINLEEIKRFNKQGLEVFKYFMEKAGRKEVKQRVNAE
jgi:hypothetical protein